MYYGFLQFGTIPEIGFAQHFKAGEYRADYGGCQKSFEIVCNIRGNFQMKFYDQCYNIKEGSIFLIFRDLPIQLRGMGGNNEYFTIQVGMEYHLEVLRDLNPPPDKEGIFLPFVVPPGREAEEIRKELILVITEIERTSGLNSFADSLRVLSILQKMNAYARDYRRDLQCSPASEKISRQVKNYIDERICKKISLSDIALKINKTPNYINHCFRQVNGITIARYIAREKILRVAELIQKKNRSFHEACEEVGINNVPYGYRLFKQYMGVTPAKYQEGEVCVKEG